MRHNLRWIVLVATVVAACGGGTTPTAGPAGATAGPGGGGATPAPVATQSGGGGGTTTSKVCELLTAGEIESIMSVTGVTGQETPIVNDSGACLFSTGGGDIAVALSYTGGAAGSMVWDTWKAQAGSVGVDGTGGDAVFVPSGETLFLFKNGKLVGIQAGLGSAGADQRKAWETELAKKIAGRL